MAFYDEYVAPFVPPAINVVVGKIRDQLNNEEAPNPGSPPTPADAAKNEADKAALRRQRAAALLAGGQRANILTSPLGIPGGQQQSGESQGRKTLLGM